jgi:polysaccharide pyruvyl transferase WcaK-like protein
VGSCALVENAITALKTRFPDARIKVMAHRPSSFIEAYRVDAIPDVFNYPFLQHRLRQLLWLMYTIVWMSFIWLLAPLYARAKHHSSSLMFRSKLEPFLWADLAISVGAERINDKYFKNITFSLFTYSLIKRLGKRVVLFPSTIGPFIFTASKLATKAVLKKVDLIYTRDEQSAINVNSLLGNSMSNMVSSIDLAIAQPFPCCEAARQLIGVPAEETIIGISVMKWSYFKNDIDTPYSNYQEYARQFAMLADAIIDKYSVTVVFYPTNFKLHGCREDDVQASKDVLQTMKNQSKAHVIEFLPTPSELKGMLACSLINITTRMHACILSTSSSTPTISVNYLFKVREYMKSLGLEQYSIDIEEFNCEWALDAFNKLWINAEACRQNLKVTFKNKLFMLSQDLDRLYDLF